jgi:hypothetical protein
VDGVCVARKENGAACGAANECKSDVCIEGVCCNTECPSGACGGCKLEGKVGDLLVRTGGRRAALGRQLSAEPHLRRGARNLPNVRERLRLRDGQLRRRLLLQHPLHGWVRTL